MTSKGAMAQAYRKYGLIGNLVLGILSAKVKAGQQVRLRPRNSAAVHQGF